MSSAGTFTIVDAHAHVIEHIAGLGRKGESRAVGRGRVRWVSGEEAQLVPEAWGDASFTHDRLIQVMDEHTISKAVLMQGSFYGFCNDYTLEAQRKHPGRLYGMGTFDPYSYEARSIMEHLISDFRFLGFKFEISRSFGLMGYHPELRLNREPMTRIWEFAQEKKLPVSLDLGTFGEPSLQIQAMKKIAGRYKGIRFVIEHLFYPGLGHYEDVRAALSQLAPFKNVSFTIASIPNSLMPEAYPFPSARRYAGIAKEVVGAQRILWGSDLPSVAVNAPYRQLIDYVAESGLFSDDELRKVYSENAVRVYGLSGTE
ncbi:MAG: amidohydrolase family protein [Spirochaetia bacterium]